MPRTKRWFAVDQNIFDDPEVWELWEESGPQAVCVWFQILAVLDRHENRICLSALAVDILARKMKVHRKTVQSVIRHAERCQWLIVGQLDQSGQPVIYEARNYRKYHQTRGTTGNGSASPPTLPYPTLREEKNKNVLPPVDNSDRLGRETINSLVQGLAKQKGMGHA